MRTSDSALWKVLKFFRLNKVYRSVIQGILPQSVNNQIAQVTLKNTVVPLVFADEIEPKFTAAWNHLIQRAGEKGDYLEFGVSFGSSLACMHRVLKKLKLENVRIFGFDSFEGLPESASVEDQGTWKPGQFASSIETTKKHLTEQGVNWQKTFLLKGWFDATLTDETIAKHNIKKASVIMIDCDIYSSSKLALDFCIPLIKSEAVIFFDDWKEDKDFGECKAFTEFLAENPQFKSKEFGTYKPTGKIYIVTNTAAR